MYQEPCTRSRTASSFSTCTTKVGLGANMLTNIPSFRHEQNLNPGGSRMEIYETISHVSTNQVWLHINSASSRVYFRPIALFFVGSAGAGQLARSYLCLESLSTPFPFPLSSTNAPTFLCSTTATFSPSLFVLHLACTLQSSLLFFALEIVYLNHPRPTSTEAPF